MNTLRFSWITVLVLVAVGTPAVAQHYSDWTGFEFLVGRFDDDGDVVYYELQKDYTISLPSYFLDQANMPDMGPEIRGDVDTYHGLASSMPPLNWDFIRIDQGGILTIKKGYRWDGASNPIEEMQHWNYRSSLVHDTMYDLMRMEYLPADHHHQIELPGCNCLDTHILWDAGDYFRALADILHYMIAVEDGDTESGALFDCVVLRNHGACRSHCEDMMKAWKYHVAEFAAYVADGQVDLSWQPADLAGRDPFYEEHFGYIYGYQIVRNSTTIHWVPGDQTSYTDTDIVNGDAYGYQIIPHPANINFDDWSNEDIVIPASGAGNALRLDGSDDYVEANTTANDLDHGPIPQNPFTMEAWVYPEDGAGIAAILSFNTISGGNDNLLMYDGGSQRFCYYDDENGHVYAAAPALAGYWHHVAVTIGFPAIGKLYVDGNLEATSETTHRPAFGSQFSIGQEYDGASTSQHFAGMIDEVRIWSEERTQAELEDAMGVPLRGDEEKLVALWHFDEPHETNLFQQTHDATVNANDGNLEGYEASDLPFVPSGAMAAAVAVDDIDQLSNHPNPFNPHTTITYAMPADGIVRLQIYDLRGRLVRTLVDETASAGWHEVSWNGRDMSGDEVSSGVYLTRLEAGGDVAHGRMSLLR